MHNLIIHDNIILLISVHLFGNRYQYILFCKQREVRRLNPCGMKIVLRCPPCFIFDLPSYLVFFHWSSPMMQEAYSVARQFNLIPPVCEQAEYHFFQREKVETQLPELYHKIGKLC